MAASVYLHVMLYSSATPLFHMTLPCKSGDYRNCSYVNADGQVIYIVETPDSDRFKKVSTVKRSEKGIVIHYAHRPGPSSDNFTDVGEIAFNASTSSSLIQFGGASIYSRSLIRLGGREYETSRFFSKVGLKNDLGFTGPDSVDYKWMFGDNALELVRRNADKTLIALFHPESLGSFDKPRSAALEVFSGGMHMVDLIVVTYIFAQKECDSRRAKVPTSLRLTTSSFITALGTARLQPY
ncbi:hypothetical protein JOM56_010290 [Amanita muscaria]